jgi:peroxiredoxin
MAARQNRRLAEVGTQAPGFSLERLGGGSVTLADILAGGPVLLAFFKISCPVCQLTLPYLEQLHASGRRIFAISQNDAEDTRDFNREFGITLPVLLDSQAAGFPASNAYAIFSVPTMFLVESGGAIEKVVEGWRKRDMELLGVQFGAKHYVPEWKAG